MDYTQQYITFMSGATGTGSLTFEIDTYDLLHNVTLVLNVSGIAGNETPQQLGQKVWIQYNTLLTQSGYLFQNVPPLPVSASILPFLAFPDQAMSPMWNVTYTEHCVCVMSQCGFTLTVTANTVAPNIVIDSLPVPITLADSKNLFPDELWEDSHGNLLTDSQIVYKLQRSSAKLLKWLRNPIVLSTFLYYEVTRGQKSVFLPKTPVRDFFAPVVRRPIIFAVQQVTANATVKQNFMLDRNRGELSYRFAQDFVYNVEPFDDQNEVMIAYESGHQKIPTVIKEYIVKLATFIHDQEFTQMTGEGSGYKFKETDDILRSWAAFLGEYFLP